MVEKQIVGNVVDEYGNIVGEVRGTYIDESQQSTSEIVESREIPIQVMVDKTVVGNGTLIYDDYVAYNGGGTRTIDVNGNVYINSTVVGTVTGSLTDEYGQVYTPQTPSTTGFPWWIILLFGVVIVLGGKRRKE